MLCSTLPFLSRCSVTLCITITTTISLAITVAIIPAISSTRESDGTASMLVGSEMKEETQLIG